LLLLANYQLAILTVDTKSHLSLRTIVKLLEIQIENLYASRYKIFESHTGENDDNNPLYPTILPDSHAYLSYELGGFTN